MSKTLRPTLAMATATTLALGIGVVEATLQPLLEVPLLLLLMLGTASTVGVVALCAVGTVPLPPPARTPVSFMGVTSTPTCVVVIIPLTGVHRWSPSPLAPK